MESRFALVLIPLLLLTEISVVQASESPAGSQVSIPETIRYDQHIRPILANHCVSCHGPDEAARKGGLRLDVFDQAGTKGDSGRIAIVPGDPASSELMARIESSDPEVRMPPPESDKQLTEIQKATLRRWIEQGAANSAHWAFQSPKRPEVPSVRQGSWVKNPIDSFVLSRLEAEQLNPSPEADPLIWLRRVTLDLTGLPPSPEDREAFLKDLKNPGSNRDQVYGSVVDRLLQSPRHAERMAMHWLDLARYADTNGYNNDESRTMWPWRDWVIDAFARGLPYDQFLTEQLAGDLLPDASLSQKVATGFNRNHVLTTEGGIIEEEYHVEYVADRVHTTASVFMAMSFQCARCHDHKFDPISQREYYQFSAFFNNIPDKVVSYSKGRMAEPLLAVPSPEQQRELEQLSQQKVDAEALLQKRSDVLAELTAAWEASLSDEQASSLHSAGLVSHWPMDQADGDDQINVVNSLDVAVVRGKQTSAPGKVGSAIALDGKTWFEAPAAGDFDSGDAFSVSLWVQPQSAELSAVISRQDEAQAYRGYDLLIENGHLICHIATKWPESGIRVMTRDAVTLNDWHHVVLTWDGSGKASGIRIFADSQLMPLEVTREAPLEGSLRVAEPFRIGRRSASLPLKGLVDDVRLWSLALNHSDVELLFRAQPAVPLKPLLSVPPPQRTSAEQRIVQHYFRDHADSTTRGLRDQIIAGEKRRRVIESEIPSTMVMAESDTRRPCFVLKRGQYDQRGDEVQADFPAVFSGDHHSVSLTSKSTAPETSSTVGSDSRATESAKTLSRLDLARWLTRPDHPLTSRVAVNRWWEMLFGTGIVETAEDFGIQGALPSHPELLDWLASELTDHHWNDRHILKQIVLSACYRQSARVTPELQERDPLNRLLARGPRFRLPAETVRDNALFVSGLLKEKAGGPSVMPYQPEGLWEDVSVERREKYVPDPGDGLYRRSMYTFWKRTCPPPSMATFDAPDRETCVIRRARTNTPLQALVLLNDPTYLEASRKLAERVLLGESSVDARLQMAVRFVLVRDADPAELNWLRELLESAEDEYAGQSDAATRLLAVGNSPSDSRLSAEEVASWTTVMSVLLNLDETISKP